MIRQRLLRAAAILSLLTLFALPALAAGGGGGGDADEYKPANYRNAVKAIKAKDYQGGIDLLMKYVAEYPKDADGYNYLGYAHRKLHELDVALKYYKQALDLDPDHRGAHEYMGEAYLELNQPDEAKKHLAALDKLCFLPCEEYSDLKKALADYESKNK
jgi:tetratricopeptide (TPR) repeat protein